jgi:hypothetical protein
MQPIQTNQCNHISLKGETKGMKTCRYKVHKDGLCETHYNIKKDTIREIGKSHVLMSLVK